MASVSYELGSVYYLVFQPRNIISEIHHPPPRCIQIDVTLSFTLVFNGHDCITDQYFDCNREPFVKQETLRLDLDVLKNHDQAFRILAPALRRVGISPTFRRFGYIIDDIIEHGLRIGNKTPNEGPKVLSLHAELLGTILMHVNSVHDLINEALLESVSEFEASNYGMIPAKESSVKQMLKKKTIEAEQDDCSICFEEVKLGSEASQMPCSHTFHDDCIKKWLKQSHYCPICRFDMPT